MNSYQSFPRKNEGPAYQRGRGDEATNIDNPDNHAMSDLSSECAPKRTSADHLQGRCLPGRDQEGAAFAPAAPWDTAGTWELRVNLLAAPAEAKYLRSLCRREGIAASMYYRWSKEFLGVGRRSSARATAGKITSSISATHHFAAPATPRTPVVPTARGWGK